MNYFKKEFAGTDWLIVINKIRVFIVDYNLELININLKQKDKEYVATIEYGLGVRNG